MVEFKINDPLAEEYLDLAEHERIREEGRQSGYNIYSPNAETVRVCRENEKKKPIPIPDDSYAYFKKLLRISD